MKKFLFAAVLSLSAFNVKSTIHVVYVWDGYYQFIDANTFNPDITILLGDTVQWLPFDTPMMVHTITSTNIPIGASAFDYTWQAPADTFFQYVPQFEGLYEYECTPHVQMNMIGSINVILPVNTIAHNNYNDIFIFPNPCQNKLNLSTHTTVFSFQVFDSSGNVVIEGKNEKFIDVSNLPYGYYQLKIVGDRVRYFKFLKSNF